MLTIEFGFFQVYAQQASGNNLTGPLYNKIQILKQYLQIIKSFPDDSYEAVSCVISSHERLPLYAVLCWNQ